MTDPAIFAALTASGLIAIGLASGALLKGWQGWLELRRIELGRGGDGPQGRPELAELRARVRRLEALASGSEG